MKTLFIACTVLTILQVLDVSITKVSATATVKTTKTVRATTTENGNTKTDTKTGSSARGLSPTNSAPENDEEENENPEPTNFVDAGKNLLGTVKNESNKRGAGLANTATSLVKNSSGTLGMFGSLIREQTNNLHKIAEAKFGLLSGLGSGLTNGAINVLQGAQEIGSEGAKVMFNTLGSAKKLGKETTKLGGNLIKAPIDMGTDVVKVGSRFTKVLPTLTKKVSGVANNALSTMGIQSDENETGDEENEPEKAAPQPAPSSKAKKPVSTKK